MEKNNSKMLGIVLALLIGGIAGYFLSANMNKVDVADQAGAVTRSVRGNISLKDTNTLLQLGLITTGVNPQDNVWGVGQCHVYYNGIMIGWNQTVWTTNDVGSITNGGWAIYCNHLQVAEFE